MSSSLNKSNNNLRVKLCSRRRLVWGISGVALFLSILGLTLCILNPSIKAPLRPGLDFTGGTQIKLERICDVSCESIIPIDINNALQDSSLTKIDKSLRAKLSQIRIQQLDNSKLLVIRLPFLSASEGQLVIERLQPLAGPFISGGQAIDTIGPRLGGQLLRSSIASLLTAFTGIALYITLRYDKRFALLALIALAHDVVIVSGIFAWFGLIFSLEVDSLFVVALLTIAGYSVNDTVVVFDRIRERSRRDASLPLSDQIDRAVSSTLTRTLYTSGTTLMPLLALIFFGGSTLFWFAIALAAGVVIGSWSSIALAPSLLSLSENKPIKDNIDTIGL